MTFRSLSTRVLVFFALLLLIVQGAGFGVIHNAIENYATGSIREELIAGERIFQRVLDQNTRQLALAARTLSDDYGFREAMKSNNRNHLATALDVHRQRVGADVMMLISPKRIVLADSSRSDRIGKPFSFPELIEDSETNGIASMILSNEERLYQFVLMPMTIPQAWLALGFPIDHRFVTDLGKLASLEISFLRKNDSHEWRLLTSTLSSDKKTELVNNAHRLATQGSLPVELAGEKYQTLVVPLSAFAHQSTTAVLQRSLNEALLPFKELQVNLLILTLIGLAISAIGSLVAARNVTAPVVELAKLANQIEQGNYSQVAEVTRKDEIGKLAAAFNHMKQGIAERETRISRLAYRDALTDLPNRALFNERLQQAVAGKLPAGTPLAVLMMDLDHFKDVNDTLGHHVGDLLLVEVGARLQSGILRKSDTIARLGGDEFAILLVGDDAASAEATARRLLDALKSPTTLDGHVVDVNASIGIAVCPEHGLDAHTLLRRADVAMYAAKRANSGFATYDPCDENHAARRLSLLSDLRHALEHGELMLYFQPKMFLASEAVSSVEALIRWLHPERGFISPDQFIPFAEHTGYIKTISRWVMNEAFKACADHRQRGLALSISINVSTCDLVSGDFTQTCVGLVQRYGIKPGWIRFEITESAMMADPARAMETLTALHLMGFELSIDDFGTGYSSLSYLKRLPVNELKIDKSFVIGMTNDKGSETIVRSTIDLGHNMGLKVVAEGIEDIEVLRSLKRMGCDLGQGFFISRPLPAEELDQWLSARQRERIERSKVSYLSRIPAAIRA